MKKFLLGLIIFLGLVLQASASQHDYVIDNAPGAAVRADINSALQAIVTNNAGATDPSTTYPDMWWFDTSTARLKRRNNANDAWIIDTAIQIASAAGTVDAITADFDPNISLADKTIVAVIASGANTSTTPTFAPDGLTTHTITKDGGSALLAGDIPAAGFVMMLEYNLANTRWELLNPSSKPYVDSKFNTTTGHDHDGTDSKKVLMTNIDTTGGTNGQYFQSNGTGGGNWQTINLKTDCAFRVRLTTAGTPASFDETDGFDTGSDFASNTFTAPVSGYYLMAVSLWVNNNASSGQEEWATATIDVSSSPDVNFRNGTYTAGGGGESFSVGGSAVIYMAQGETAHIDTSTEGGNSSFATNNIAASYWSCVLVEE